MLVPVILSGGSGNRLWPVSRETCPKQFWPLVTDYSLLQETALRCLKVEVQAKSGAIPQGPLMVMCNQEHRFKVAEQLQTVGVSDARIVLEPEGRSSAPAIAAASLMALEMDADALLWVMPADAAIPHPEHMDLVLGRAVEAAQCGRIVAFGMTPTRAETGYGYIEKGVSLKGMEGVFDVVSFIEKPDVARAECMKDSGRHFWNAGMFVFRADVMIEDMQRYQPALLDSVRMAVSARHTDLDFIRLDAEAFCTAPDISIDYAIAEKSRKMAVVPACFDWSDVGSWEALWAIGTKDRHGNVVAGDVLLHDTVESYVRTEGILTVVSGMDHAVVVVMPDAVLVTHRDQAQNVKHLVARLKEMKRPEVVTHNLTYRPWGAYESLTRGERFQVKRIVVKPGQKLSLQKHRYRAEHWVVVEGRALVTRDGEQSVVCENESLYLPPGCVHRLENPDRTLLTLIEVQSGSYLGEDDIVRYDDIYARS